jgi:hypothetical protein
MPTTYQDKPGNKQRQRNQKTDKRGQKPGQQQKPKPDQRDEDQISAMTASTDTSADRIVAAADAPLIGEVTAVDASPKVSRVDVSPEVAPVDISSSSAVAPADHRPISIQTIANAYGNYTRKSLQESHCLVEKLLGVRSFDKAVEVQTEFARQAHANFVAESQKIFELYGELARQMMFRPWEGFVAKVTRVGR